jgi:hypothetical protein
MTRRMPAMAAAAAGIAFAVAAGAVAGEPTAPGPGGDAWKTECASCHIAYPPRLLPADSWRAIMKALERHFGTDASIDAATAASIAAFLERNAGRVRSASSAMPVLRITETRWFLREHDDIGASRWRDPKIRSAANCGACHPRAEDGRFGERDVRIPR